MLFAEDFSMADVVRFPNLEPADARLADSVFEFVQFLLDDDANLTPAGNLTGGARQKLRARLEELIAAEQAGAAETAAAGSLFPAETSETAEAP
jgi:hypothetical protein